MEAPRMPADKLKQQIARMTFTWVCGLIIAFTLGLFWLCTFGVAIFQILRAHGAGEVGGYVVIFGLALVVSGIALRWFVNRFYHWYSGQRLNSVLKEIDGGVSKAQAQTRTDKKTGN
jgi:hypothetical protein